MSQKAINQQVDAPAHGALTLTGLHSDTVNLAHYTRGIYVGGAGDLKALMADGVSVVTFTGLVQGMVYPFAVARIYSTDTTATLLIGLY